MIVDAGYIALIIALLVAIYTVVASFLGVWQKLPTLVLSGRYGFFSVPFMLLISTASLVYAFVTNDFSVKYVSENSNLSMPVEYTWVAIYAGNAGSLLFIAFVFSILCVIAITNVSKRLPFTAPFTTGLLASVLAFFLLVMVLLANPLERLTLTPADGQGINPLLVHFGMFIHPPVQMSGLILVAIPFSIGMGALMSGRGGMDEWVDLGRLWGMVSWIVLTFGLMLGSWWAYTILGWGGYWAWDPVENSALMPWLAMTAFVHSVMVQKRRGMFRMWNIILLAVAFSLAQMGMFINRGGPVPSVHSFAQSSMGWIFLAFIAVTLLGSLIAFVWRLGTLKSLESLDSLLSRESAFLTQNVLFLLVAFVTLWGTIYPVISSLFQEQSITVGEPYFNQVNGPILLAIVCLMGVGPLLPWRRARVRNVLSILRYPLIAAVVTCVLLISLGVRNPSAVVAFSVIAVVVTAIFHEWIRGVRSRHRNGEAYFIAWVRLMNANRPRYGGYVIHLAIAMLAVGIVGSTFYGVQRDFTLNLGEAANFGGYRFGYISLDKIIYPDREEMSAYIEVHDGDEFIGVMKATRSFYPDFRIAATRAAIRSTPIEDFYVVPSEFAVDGSAVFRVYINPLVWWMWVSGVMFFVGTLFALVPRRGARFTRKHEYSQTRSVGA